uniref:Putative secreted protein n=1 Tax=Anopheles darlingi TaxID=43151 RepID=A0A2M4D879_ANODA
MLCIFIFFGLLRFYAAKEGRNLIANLEWDKHLFVYQLKTAAATHIYEGVRRILRGRPRPPQHTAVIG